MLKDKLVTILKDMVNDDYYDNGTFYTKNNHVRTEFIFTLLGKKLENDYYDSVIEAIDSISEPDAIDFIEDCKVIVEHGTGNAGYYIYISDCYEFVKRHLEQIFSIVQDYEKESGLTLSEMNKDQDYAVFLTWFVYEIFADDILLRLDQMEEFEE